MTSADTALLDRLIPAGPPDPPSLRATNWLLTHGMPDPHDEAWRYSPVKEILSRLAVATPAQPSQITHAEIDRLAGNHGPNRLVLVNGAYEPALSDLEAHADGSWIGRLADLPPGTVSTAVPVGGGFTDGFHACSTGPLAAIPSSWSPKQTSDTTQTALRPHQSTSCTWPYPAPSHRSATRGP